MSRATSPAVEAALPDPPQPSALTLHHVGVQTSDLDNTIAWYGAFFGGEVRWTLSTFSDTTHSRVPGIGTLVEMTCGGVRFHLFDRAATTAVPPDREVPQYQHVCLEVGSPPELRSWREHWLSLFRSGRFTYTVRELPTEVVVDADGVESFYCRDVTGLELEFTYVPSGAS